jgi:phenylacetate-CoA ligase
MDHLTVRVEARVDCPAERHAPAVQELVGTVKDTVGVSVDCVVEAPDTLERSVGKLQRIVDLRSR